MRDDDRALQNGVRPRGFAVSQRADTTLADLENITSAWVSWYNEHRLMNRLRRIPPAEAEAEYYARLHAGDPSAVRRSGVAAGCATERQCGRQTQSSWRSC